LLRDYIRTYSIMAGVEMPEHIDAMRLLVAMEEAPSTELANIILQNGLTISEAVNVLLDALTCSIPSVRRQVENMLTRLYTVLEKEISQILQKRQTLAVFDQSEKKNINRMLEQIAKIKAKAENTRG
ncbi:MAG: hypothetical protein ACYSUS_09745, partial [Planctomycetota bacterium]